MLQYTIQIVKYSSTYIYLQHLCISFCFKQNHANTLDYLCKKLHLYFTGLGTVLNVYLLVTLCIIHH